jgi:hypothetical protein
MADPMTAIARGVHAPRSAANVGWAAFRTLVWLAAALWMLLEFRAHG